MSRTTDSRQHILPLFTIQRQTWWKATKVPVALVTSIVIWKSENDISLPQARTFITKCGLGSPKSVLNASWALLRFVVNVIWREASFVLCTPVKWITFAFMNKLVVQFKAFSVLSPVAKLWSSKYRRYQSIFWIQQNMTQAHFGPNKLFQGMPKNSKPLKPRTIVLAAEQTCSNRRQWEGRPPTWTGTHQLELPKRVKLSRIPRSGWLLHSKYSFF